ncbi:RNA-binding KH domain-containing protein PEPPER isoform X2 [Cicer arietinum]|uniref:RNA-binding KH domain-containing protein PEPPER isoform X2 n=1 Tax=Cicer arietinum TaxID=3827 RepID=A0A1S2XE95_CICAR|nr:RNA-binding KH domain-containing protein PEPPER isoform X2 [Cicer arietinum]
MATAELPQNGTTTTTTNTSNPLLPDNSTAVQPLTTDADSVNTAQATNELTQEPETATHTGTDTNSTAAVSTATPPEKKWPGWPGDCVFRLVVPVSKVGSIIGRKGELIKKLCDETKARVRVLDAPIGTPDRIVLISGKEEPEAAISPAMDAALRIFKRVSGLSETDSEFKGSAGTFCSFRLLVASTQAISLIGKQGSLIKSIQESSGASVRVLSGDEVQRYATAEERIVDMQGEALKVLKAFEVVIGHLRKFLVDRSVLPQFEKTYNASISSQDRQAETWSDKPSLNTTSQNSMFSDRDSIFADRESHLDSLLASSTMSHSLYGQDSSLSGRRSSSLSRAGAPIVTTEVIRNHRESMTNSYGRLDAGVRASYSQSSYSQLGNTSRIPPSSLSSQPPYTGYGVSGLEDYSTFRL